ncbi:mRNA-capping enzyme [Tetranychus urticae]|uniref:mRNA-capping enzyme n=1 Tax=Tetranychus urticae TaxID=32264 RepID=T1KJ23_TETUR|nr:mRNA-capping enzyme [Tetranychus urticae]
MAERYVLPPRWLKCPRRSDLIADKFVAIKTPLDDNYKDLMNPGQFWTPEMALRSFKTDNVNIGLWIDLTNTSRFYNKEIIEKKDVKYVKIQCRGHGECPSPEQTRTFVNICSNFFSSQPMKKILVHCTHGFNRTGFLVCAYLVERQDWSIEASVNEFSKCRKPGIYKGDYLKELFDKYGDVEDTPDPPQLPSWCYDEEDADDDVVNNGNTGSSSGSSRRDSIKSNATFMEGISGVSPADPKIWHEIQRKCKDMCEWHGSNFPGSQPVSLDFKNIHLLKQKNYLVSWKADGTRYMMLIDGEDRIYFIDRDNAVFQARGIRFPKRKDLNGHLSNTLLDGEMIIDEHQGQKTPRYLIYDIIRFENQEVGKMKFDVRLVCIKREIINPREEAKRAGIIDRAREPFGIRQKEFWPIHSTKALFGASFTQQLSHEIDGLIFQPLEDPYRAGQCPESLKWKPETHNSIDFKAQIYTVTKVAQLTEKYLNLYVGRCTEPFSQMKYSKEFKDLNGKIIECTWDYDKKTWKFMRVRTDKSFPNSLDTANAVMETILRPISKDALLNFIETIPHHQKSTQKRPYPSNDRNLMPPPPSSDVDREHKKRRVS